ncbi:MAG: alpha-L-fucosidase [Alloprevotella sp.]|nr:alpha-L-fucosidase [Alloprevotella sp.]
MRSYARTLTAAAIALAAAIPATAQTYVPTPENLAARQKFADSKFGIFLHWGLYAMFAQGEWYMTNENINCHEYAKSAAAFYPHNFDAAAWIAAIKASGARYITFTSRHHEGFSMWDSQASDYNIMHTPYGRDIVRQLADECHKQGIGLHLYYSHLDWTREDYPRGRTGLGTGRTGDKQGDWKSYYNFMNRQLTELLTGYGDIGAIWFDGWWDHDEDSIPFNWELEEQYALIHRLQPACLVGNNHHQTPFPGEDIQIFERDVPGENKAGFSGQDISHLPLETCQTMNGMWGYKIKDQNYKSVRTLVQLLVRTAGKGANLLLNIGPQPDGSLPAAALERLSGMGSWLATNGESIYGTTGGEVTEGEAVVSTRKGELLYLHVLAPGRDSVRFETQQKVKRVSAFGSTTPLPFTQKRGTVEISFPCTPQDNTDYIIVVE